MSSLKLIFMGSPEFALPSLRQFQQSRHTVQAVVSGPDKKRGRGGKKTPTPVKALALDLGFPVIEADSMKAPGLADRLRSYQPDLFVVVAFKILPPELLEVPALGAVNLHASRLPEFRGAAPIHHAVMQGKKETGCTIFRLNAGVDTGGIISQTTTTIGPDETTGEVYERLMNQGAAALTEAVDAIAEGRATYTPQDDAKASKAPKLFEEDCRLRFDQPAAQVHNHIRGLSPFPAAFAFLDNKKIKLLRSRIEDEKPHDKPPGTLESDKQRAFLYCQPGRLELADIKYEGRRQMSAADFLRGYQGSARLM